jgi:hypothetical protein
MCCEAGIEFCSVNVKAVYRQRMGDIVEQFMNVLKKLPL